MSNFRRYAESMVGSLAGVLVGGIISFLIIGAQARMQTRAEQTTAAYSAYVEAIAELAQAVRELDGPITSPGSTPAEQMLNQSSNSALRSDGRMVRERLGAARGRIAIYGTPSVIAAIPVVGTPSIHDESVKAQILAAIGAMRDDVGEERIDACELRELVFGENCEGDE